MTRRDQGSVLMLMPAAVLIVVVLAAITVDLSLVRLRHEQLENVAAAAANDAANQLSTATLRSSDDPAALPTIELAPDDVAAIVDETVARQGLESVSVLAATSTGGQVVVVLSMEVDHIFGRALPGTPPTRRVSARATASLVLSH